MPLIKERQAAIRAPRPTHFLDRRENGERARRKRHERNTRRTPASFGVLPPGPARAGPPYGASRRRRLTNAQPVPGWESSGKQSFVLRQTHESAGGSAG